MTSRTDWLTLTVVLLATLGTGWLHVHLRPDSVYSDHFLFADNSLNLLAAETILQGGTLYKDVFFQYGPVPIYCYTAWAGIFGNTPTSYIGFQTVLNLLHLALMFAALRSCTTLRTTLLVVVAAIPIMQFPVAVYGAYPGAAYIPFERCCQAALVLAWSPPGTRTGKRAILLGTILGFWQCCKFGVCFYAGLALLLLDGLALAMDPQRPWKSWLRASCLTLAGFLAFQLALIVGALLWLPRPIALDFIWPQYVLQTYFVGWHHRWPQFWDGYFFLGAQWTPLVGLLLGLAGMGVLLKAHRDAEHPPDSSMRLFFPLAFYILASTSYFGHEHMFYQSMWMLLLPAGWLLDRLPPWRQVQVGFLWLPAVLILLKIGYLAPIPADRVAFNLPTGEQVYLEPAMAEWLPRLLATLDDLDRPLPDGQPSAMMFVPMGAGLHQIYGIPHATRSIWFLPAFIRPYDEAELIASLDRTRAVVAYANSPIENADPQVWGAIALPASVRAALQDRLDAPIKVHLRCWVFPVKPGKGL